MNAYRYLRITRSGPLCAGVRARGDSRDDALIRRGRFETSKSQSNRVLYCYYYYCDIVIIIVDYNIITTTTILCTYIILIILRKYIYYNKITIFCTYSTNTKISYTIGRIAIPFIIRHRRRIKKKFDIFAKIFLRHGVQP